MTDVERKIRALLDYHGKEVNAAEDAYARAKEALACGYIGVRDVAERRSALSYQRDVLRGIEIAAAAIGMDVIPTPGPL